MAAIPALAIVAVLAWQFAPLRLSGATVLAPEPAGAAVSFLAVGDTGTGSRAQIAVARAMERLAARERNVNFVLMLGDNFYFDGVSSVDDRLWSDRFEGVYRGPYLDGMRFYALPGNHDARGDIDAQIAYSRRHLGSGRWTMPNRSYVRDFGTLDGRPLLRLMTLDLTGWFSMDAAAREQFVGNTRATMEAAFAPDSAAGVAHWRVVASHFPLRTADVKYGATYLQTIDSLASSLLGEMRAHCVDLYLSGHAHNLQLLRYPDEPLHVISGAGGKQLYAVDTAHPHAEFAVATFGFVEVGLAAQTMDIRFFDADARLLHHSMEIPRTQCLAAAAR